MGRKRALEGVRIVPGKNRALQVAPTGRKLFTKPLQRRFLEHLAATCNVQRSCAAAGITYSTVYRHRMNDEAFREAWGRALEQGYARLEASVLAQAGNSQRIPVDGDLDVEPEADWDKAMQLLREHKRGLAGVGKQGAPRKPVDMEEMRARLVRKLRAIGVKPVE